MEKFILNSTFRSGSTFFWRELVHQNPEAVILYEPCHENLNRLLRRFRGLQGTVNERLHGASLWNGYTEEHLKIVQRWGDYRICDLPFRNVPRYAGELLSAESRVDGLQVNRWHFFLDALLSEGLTVVHLVRNPWDVFQSIQLAALTSRNRWRSYLKSWLMTSRQRQLWAFNLGKFYGQTLIFANFPNRAREPWDRFLVWWCLSNLAAIRALDKHGHDYLLVYEALPHDRERVEGIFKQVGYQLQLAESCSPSGNGRYDDPRVLNRIDRLGLTQEYDECLQAIRGATCRADQLIDPGEEQSENGGL